jgi:hypothetical protein
MVFCDPGLARLFQQPLQLGTRRRLSDRGLAYGHAVLLVDSWLRIAQRFLKKI